ncbi:MAG: hypothetical protein MOB07_28690 [Acidobacteria bacterium]|nr:hypothetical protein [Acidobacteriota bacterium]
MTEQFANYDEFFHTAFADKEGRGQQPFDYQRRLALAESLPSLVNAPNDWPGEKERYLRRGSGNFRSREAVVIEVEFDFLSGALHPRTHLPPDPRSAGIVRWAVAGDVRDHRSGF